MSHSSNEPLERSWAPKDPPELPGFPRDQAISSEPVEGVSLEAYAKISARLAEGTSEPDLVLLEHRLTPAKWLWIEREWALRIAASMLRGDLSLARAHDEAYVAAQSALGASAPTRSLTEYAALVAGMETAAEAPPVVLARHGLTVADFARLSRAWNERLGRDVHLSKLFRARVAEVKTGSLAPERSGDALEETSRG